MSWGFFGSAADPQMTCVVVVGTTGMGKSTLINMFCDGSAHVSASAFSQTTKCAIYPDRNEQFRNWMDTRGWDDSFGVADEDVYRSIMHEMFKKETKKIQVVWMVPASSRKTDSLQSQARFISSLGHFGDGESAVWRSVLMVFKKNDLEPDEDDKQGALEAAQSCGADCDIPAIGYTALDHLDAKVWEKKRRKANRMDPANRKEEGLLFDTEIVEEVGDRLRQLLSISVVFVKKECSRCGIIGDERCVPRGCHTTVKFVHANPNEFAHKHPLKKNQIRVCPKGHKMSWVLDGKSEGKSYSCGKCAFTSNKIFWCPSCKTWFCGEESVMSTTDILFVGTLIAVGGAGVVMGGAATLAALAVEETVAAVGLGAMTGVELGAAAIGGRIAKVAFGSRCSQVVYGYPCCDQMQGSRGCSYACCHITIGQSNGCKPVCNKCGLKWRSHGRRACDVNSEHSM